MEITRKTSYAQFQAATKQDLAAYLMKRQPIRLGPVRDVKELLRWSKTDLAKEVWSSIEADLKHEQQQAEAEEQVRQRIVEEQKAKGHVTKGLKSLVSSLSKILKAETAVIERFQDEISKGYILHALTWQTESVFRSSEFLYHELFLPYLVTQIENQTDTAEEMLAHFHESVVELTNECLRDSYHHNSTNAIDNIKNMATFRARQDLCKVMMQVEKYWTKYLTSNDTNSNVFELIYIRNV